jgi:hypothetical protein
MSKPDQEQIEHWLKVGRDGIEQTRQDLDEGYYEKKSIPLQSVYTGLAMDHASIGRSAFLNGDPVEVARGSLAKAAKCVLKSFTMAYDTSDPEYQDWRTDWSEVKETIFIRGMSYALMSCDFELAKELATWFQERGDGTKMDPPINRYVWALKYAVLDQREKAWSDYLKPSMDDYAKKPAKGSNWRSNYFTLSTALAGILLKDAELFNQGLDMQLQFYSRDTKGEAKDTPKEFICDNAVALANLGIHSGLKVTVQNELLPRGLLINT